MKHLFLPATNRRRAMFNGKRSEANGERARVFDPSKGLKTCYCHQNCPTNGILKSASPAQQSCGSTRVTKIVVPVPRVNPQSTDDHQLKNRTIKVQVTRNKMKRRPFKPAPARYSPRIHRVKQQAVAKTVPEKPLSPQRPPFRPPTPTDRSASDATNTPWSEILAKHSKIPSNDIYRTDSENDLKQKYHSRRLLLRKDRGSQTFDFDKVVEVVNAENIYVKNRGVQCYLSENSVLKPGKNGQDFTISCFEEALLQRLVSRFKEELKIVKKVTPTDSLWPKSREIKSESENSKNNLVNAQREIEQLKSQLEDRSQELAKSHKRETELKTAVDEAQKRVDAMSAQFVEFRQVIVTNTERVRQLQAENRALRRAEQALPEAIEEVDRLRTELSIVTLDRDKARTYLSLKDDEIAQLKDRLELLNDRFFVEPKKSTPAIDNPEKPKKQNSSTSLVTYPKCAAARPDAKAIQRSPSSGSRSTSAGSIETLKATLTEVFDMIKKGAATMVKEAEHHQKTMSKVKESGDFFDLDCGPQDTISQDSCPRDSPKW